MHFDKKEKLWNANLYHVFPEIEHNTCNLCYQNCIAVSMLCYQMFLSNENKLFLFTVLTLRGRQTDRYRDRLRETQTDTETDDKCELARACSFPNDDTFSWPLKCLGKRFQSFAPLYVVPFFINSVRVFVLSTIIS